MNVLIISSIVFTLFWQSQSQFINAPIRRLSPKTFHQLPAAVTSELESRKCLITQIWGDRAPHNVIRGSFTGEKKNEWAVLCSWRGVSSILIFQAATARLVAEIAPAKDENYQQDVDGRGTLGFSRSISAVGGDFILEHYKAYGGPEPPPIDHQGINDAFVEKASVVRYFHRGKWLELQGAD